MSKYMIDQAGTYVRMAIEGGTTHPRYTKRKWQAAVRKGCIEGYGNWVATQVVSEFTVPEVSQLPAPLTPPR